MAKLNMVKVSTLFKKGYLLAGVVMAANMFAVNEMKASNSKNNEEDNPETLQVDLKQQLLDKQNQQMENHAENTNSDKEEEKKDGEGDQKKQGPLDRLLSYENIINLFGTLALSGANNYFKWWDYNAGSYCNLRIGCLGWRTKKFFDIVQLDFNLNLGRGAIWLIPHIINLIMIKTKAKKENTEEKKQNEEENDAKSGSNASPWVSFLFKGILQGLISIPLTFHISNFSIAISLDSMLWAGIGFFLDKGKNNEEKGGIKTEEEKLKEIDTKKA